MKMYTPPTVPAHAWVSHCSCSLYVSWLSHSTNNWSVKRRWRARPVFGDAEANRSHMQSAVEVCVSVCVCATEQHKELMQPPENSSLTVLQRVHEGKEKQWLLMQTVHQPVQRRIRSSHQHSRRLKVSVRLTWRANKTVCWTKHVITLNITYLHSGDACAVCKMSPFLSQVNIGTIRDARCVLV